MRGGELAVKDNERDVDFILTGGDWDFLLMNLIASKGDDKNYEPGIWYRGGDGSVKNTGRFLFSPGFPGCQDRQFVLVDIIFKYVYSLAVRVIPAFERLAFSS